MEPSKESSTQQPLLFNKMAYGAFVLLGLYFLIFNKSVSDFLIQFGIALVFDPFDPAIRWNNRPIYQRAWLLIHVSILLVVAIWFFFVTP
ncbi:MAG: hypothetical protein K1X82_06080 [Bacteroidia bacterium]|nr:hypothetical protein [Bacteroidia bacterium]